MPVSDRNLEFAVQNIARYGDTDVFPFPLENHWLHDTPKDVVGLLSRLDRDFDGWLRSYPVTFVKSLSSVGYFGFRGATQIDPIWNAYLLGLVLEIAPDLEAARVDRGREVVFSYRFSPAADTYTLFDPDLGWARFHRTALAKATSFEYVVFTDLSDFYARAYHHRLENALRQATKNTEAVGRIMELLKRLAGGVSYGLPIGGHAARMLAELLLNRTDRLMSASGIQFCRFVDDYFLFAASQEDAQSGLVRMSEILLANEGLTLSRAKTRVMSRSEFLRTSPLAEPAEATSEEEASARAFLRLRLTFDPYSPTASQDYDQLKEHLERFDITAMLARELRKSRIDEAITRQLIKSLRFVAPEVRDGAVLSLLQNLNVLYPVFPTVAILLRQLIPDLSDDTRIAVFDTVRDLITKRSHIVLVPTNLSYAIRLLAFDRAEDTDALLIDLYGRAGTDMLIKRDIILSMTRRRVDYWLSDLLKRFAVLSPWERRALIPASYVLGDEGRHWREHVRDELHELDRGFLTWVGSKNSGRSWELPL